MARKRIGSAKENLYYHNTLILHKSEKQTVKNQLGLVGLTGRRVEPAPRRETLARGTCPP